MKKKNQENRVECDDVFAAFTGYDYVDEIDPNDCRLCQGYVYVGDGMAINAHGEWQDDD